MPAPGSPVSGSLLARRQLGRRRRALRKQAGKIQVDVETSGIASEAKLYRMETGRVPIRPGEVRELCVLYRAPEEMLDSLLALARASKEGRGQEEYADVLIPGFGLLHRSGGGGQHSPGVRRGARLRAPADSGMQPGGHRGRARRW